MFVDTNYFLRFLLSDVEHQHDEAKKLFLEASEGKKKLVTSTIVYFEIYWVLFSFYKKNKTELIEALQNILKLTFIELAERDILSSATALFKKTNFNLEDCYNLCFAKEKNLKLFKTFDKKLAKEFNK